MKSDLVVFGEDWGRHPSSTQHLIRQLSGDRRVLWVNSIGMRRPKLGARDVKRIWEKASGIVSGHRAQAPETDNAPCKNLSVLAPFAVPWPGSRLAGMLNRRTLGRQIGRNLQARNMSRPIVWASLPTATVALGTLNERAVVYYCGDDFGALAGVDHAPVLEMETRLVERADLIIAASETLAERFPASKTLLLPHGVDHDLFATPCERASDLPSDGPVAGFYGSLASWLDYDMLIDAARELSDWTFVFIGRIESDLGGLASLPNVRLLGERPHHALPSYVQHWDVSLLPFRDCPQITACNPLKLREYLAAGTPIATTRFPALAPYERLTQVAASPVEFTEAIRQAGGDRARNELRRRFVARDSWQSRAAQLESVLEAL